MNIASILEYLPHRYPFLLIDRVLELRPGQSLIGLKNVTYNEPFFPGHFPQESIMPGVLIIEAMAQATGILAFKTDEASFSGGAMYYLAGVDNARFKRPVIPGDQLVVEVTLRRSKRGIGLFNGLASVDGEVVASAELMCARRPMLTG